MSLNDATFSRRFEGRRRKAFLFVGVCIVALLLSVSALVLLLADVFWDGVAWLDLEFLTSFPSRFPQQAGVKSALFGSLWMLALTALFSFPIGVGAAVYLQEYAPRHWLTQIIQTNIANLAGVPSIVYGLLGLAVFVRALHFERSVLSGSLTMALLVLPIVIISSREALRAVPDSIRTASLALGATRWQTIWYHVLPAALPGILTGTILALSRAIGETAPLIMIGALTFIAFTPASPFDPFTVLPIQIFNWVSRPQKDFHSLAAAGIIVLLVVLLTMNALAILLRNRYRKKVNW